MFERVGKNILHYKLIKQIGSPSEILVCITAVNIKSIISPGKPYKLRLFKIPKNDNITISRAKGGNK